MTPKKTILALIPMLVFSANLLAASLVETKREESSDIMYVDGHRMLITGMGQDVRMIMDLQKKKAFMVNPKNKSAMDMSEATWKALKAAGEKKSLPKVEARLEEIGDGPEIAGYKTTHYKIYVDGYLCMEKWTSRRALKDSGFDEIWEKHGEFLVSAGIDADAHPCELGEYQVFRDDEYGVALKEIDHNCETSEVLRIEHDIDFDRSLLDVPSDYKLVKMPSYSGSIPQGSLQADGTWAWIWDGMDCSENGPDYAGMYDEEMDEEYLDEEYADAENAEDFLSVDEMAEEVVDEEVEDLGDEIKNKFKGFMKKFDKKDKD